MKARTSARSSTELCGVWEQLCLLHLNSKITVTLTYEARCAQALFVPCRVGLVPSSDCYILRGSWLAVSSGLCKPVLGEEIFVVLTAASVCTESQLGTLNFSSDLFWQCLPIVVGYDVCLQQIFLPVCTYVPTVVSIDEGCWYGYVHVYAHMCKHLWWCIIITVVMVHYGNGHSVIIVLITCHHHDGLVFQLRGWNIFKNLQSAARAILKTCKTDMHIGCVCKFA